VILSISVVSSSCVGEGSGLLVVQVLRIGEHDPPVLTVDVAVGVDRGDNGETVFDHGGYPVTTTRARAQ
jgi:hypothetical protein